MKHSGHNFCTATLEINLCGRRHIHLIFRASEDETVLDAALTLAQGAVVSVAPAVELVPVPVELAQIVAAHCWE
jgi:hypothetical protein